MVQYNTLTIEQSWLEWVSLPVNLADDSEEKENEVILSQWKGAENQRQFVAWTGRNLSIAKSVLPPLFSLTGIRADNTKVYLALNIDRDNDQQINIVAVDESGGPGAPVEGGARVAGTVQIDGQPAERDVIVISNEGGERQVVGEGRSEGDGSFDITFDYTGPVITLAVDDYGRTWEPETLLEQGELIHPVQPNGYVFIVTVGGTTGADEPVWNTDGTTQSGDVTLDARPYYRPIASGPLKGEPVDPENGGQ